MLHHLTLYQLQIVQMENLFGNSGTQSGIYVDNTSLGFAVVANGTTASSGLLFIGQNNGFKHSM
jgi:hypothetical protein